MKKNTLLNGEKRIYISPKELAERWGKTRQHWTRKCGSMEIPSKFRFNGWQIPMWWVLKTEGETDEEKQCY